MFPWKHACNCVHGCLYQSTVSAIFGLVGGCCPKSVDRLQLWGPQHAMMAVGPTWPEAQALASHGWSPSGSP